MPTYNKRSAIFERPRTPSLGLLQGLERAVPPPTDSSRITSSPKMLKPLPPAPKIVMGHVSSAVTPHSSSFGPPTLWNQNEEQMPDQLLRFRHNETYSANSPQLAMKDPDLPVLERTFAPLLPEPSPSLSATSQGSSDLRTDTDLRLLDGLRDKQLPIDSFPSPPSPELQLLSPPQVPQLRLQGSSESLPSPSTHSLVLPDRARSSSPPSDRLRWPLSPGPTISHDHQFQSHLKVPLGPDVAYQADTTPAPSAYSKRSLVPSAANIDDEPTEKALSSFDINKDGPDDARRRSIARRHKKVTSKERTETDSDMLPGTYHNVLVEQYRALAAPTTGQWDESSDEEVAGTFRFVPKPLFWIHKGRNAPVARIEEQRSETEKHRIIHQRRSSLSDAPLRLMLPSHHRSKSDESGGSPVVKDQKHPSILRSSKKLLWRKAKASKEKIQTPASPSLQPQPPATTAESLIQPSEKSLLKTSDKPVISPRFPHGFLQPAIQRDSDEQEESGHMASQRIDVVQLDNQSSDNPTSTSHIRTVSADTKHSTYSTTSEDNPNTATLAPSYPCAMKRSPTVSVRTDPQGQQREALSNRAATQKSGQVGLKRIITRAKDSISPLTSPRNLQHVSQPSNASSDSSSKRDSKEPSTTHGNEEKDLFRLPGFVQKTFESRREQAREKWREDLKKKINVVGEADPIHDIQYDLLSRKRETFGEGWI